MPVGARERWTSGRVVLQGFTGGVDSPRRVTAEAEVDGAALAAACPDSYVAELLSPTSEVRLSPHEPLLLPLQRPESLAWVAECAAAPPRPPVAPPQACVEEALELSFGFLGAPQQAAAVRARVASLSVETCVEALQWAEARRCDNMQAARLHQGATAHLCAHLAAHRAGPDALQGRALVDAVRAGLCHRLVEGGAAGLDGCAAAVHFFLAEARLDDALALPAGKLGAWVLGQSEDDRLVAAVGRHCERLCREAMRPEWALCGAYRQEAVVAALKLPIGHHWLEQQLAAGRWRVLERLDVPGEARWCHFGFEDEELRASLDLALRRDDVRWLNAALALGGRLHAVTSRRVCIGPAARRWLTDFAAAAHDPFASYRRAQMGLTDATGEVTDETIVRALPFLDLFDADVVRRLLLAVQNRSPGRLPRTLDLLTESAVQCGDASVLDVLRDYGVEVDETTVMAMARRLGLPRETTASIPRRIEDICAAERALSSSIALRHPAAVQRALARVDKERRRDAARAAFLACLTRSEWPNARAARVLVDALEVDHAFARELRAHLRGSWALANREDDTLGLLAALVSTYPAAMSEFYATAGAALLADLATGARSLVFARLGELSAVINRCGVPTDVTRCEEIMTALLLGEGPAATAAAAAFRSAAPMAAAELARAHLRAVTQAAFLGRAERHLALIETVVAEGHLAGCRGVVRQAAIHASLGAGLGAHLHRLAASIAGASQPGEESAA